MDGEGSEKGEETKGHKKMGVKDFETLQFLGEGSYAKVTLVRHKATGNIFAMKAILKSHMTKVEKG